MKIAIWNNLQSGGGKRALYNHVKGLLERGHEVVSFCPDTADTNFMPLSDLVEEHVFSLKEDIKKKIFLKSNYLKIRPLTKLMLSHCKKCAEVINNQDFDILFANSSADFYISHIGRFVDVPKLIYLGEPNRFLYEAKPEWLWKAPLVERNLIQYFISRCKHLVRMYFYSYLCREEYISAKSYDLILANSYFSRESIKRCYNLDAKVCYLGIDTDKFNIKIENKGNYVIGMGYIQPSKGIETVIDSLANIEFTSRPSLYWISNNNKNNQYFFFIQDYAKSKNVELIVKTLISDSEVVKLLSRARVFLYFPTLEPFGLAPLEANACGTAVISIAEGGPRESIKDGINGYLINDLSCEQISCRIRLFCGDSSFAIKMGLQARKYIIDNWNLKLGTDNIEDWVCFLMKKYNTDKD